MKIPQVRLLRAPRTPAISLARGIFLSLCAFLLLLFASSCGTASKIDCGGYYKPVCGSDAKSYDNDCYARLAQVSNWIPGECPFPSDGLFVHFKMGDARVRMYLTDPKAKEDVQETFAGHMNKHIPMGTVRKGRLFDPQWSWYVDPKTISMADVAIELCDAAPSLIEENLREWLDKLWCPWSSRIEGIEGYPLEDASR